jgi:hypothetical protein
MRIFSVPRLELVDSESGYHGLIREDELLVEVKPRIRATGAEICGFRILNRHHGDTPFEVSPNPKPFLLPTSTTIGY